MLSTGVEGRPGLVAGPLQPARRPSRLHALGDDQQARRGWRLHALAGIQQHWGCRPDMSGWQSLQDWGPHSAGSGQETVDQAAWGGPSAAWKLQGRHSTGEPWRVWRGEAAWAPAGRAAAWRPQAVLAAGAPAQRRGLDAVAWAAWETQAEAQAAGQRAAADAVRERLARGAALEAAEAAKTRLAASRRGGAGVEGRGAALEVAEAAAAHQAADQHGGLGWARGAGGGASAGSVVGTAGVRQAQARQAVGAAAEGVQAARGASGRIGWRAERARRAACADGGSAVGRGVLGAPRAGDRARRVEGWAAPRSEANEEMVEALQVRGSRCCPSAQRPGAPFDLVVIRPSGCRAPLTAMCVTQSCSRMLRTGLVVWPMGAMFCK